MLLGAIAVPHPPLIIPEVGQGQEKGIQSTIDAYREAARWVVDKSPETVVITSPHSVMYGDYFHISPGEGARGDFGNFRAPEVKVTAEYDVVFRKQLCALADKEVFPAGVMGEKNPALDHATLIPLHFLQEAGFKGKVVRIGLSGLSRRHHYHLGEMIAQTARLLKRPTVLVASGDLSHKLLAEGPYGFDPAGPVFDERMQECFRDGDFLKLLSTPNALADSAAECGLRSFWIMAGAMDRRKVVSHLLAYEGPFGVGYGTAIFEPGERDEGRAILDLYEQEQREKIANLRAREDAHLALARASLEHFVKRHEYLLVPADLPAALQGRHGAFVSIKKDGALRGCIGTFLPTRDNLAQEIIYNAVSAGLNDPRFSQVTEAELSELVYDVDVLTEPEPIDSPKKLDVRRYGVIVQAGNRRGLLLPDLDGVDTVEQQISIARRKGNIGEKEKVQLYRFEVERHI